MRRCPRHSVLGAGLLALLGSGAWASAQEEEGLPAPREGDTVSWYVVEPGDTLEAITERFLGTRVLWRENWRLNPGLRDPELLRIGQRLRIITERLMPRRTAQVTRIARRVEEKPHPGPWQPAQVGSVLEERDGVRTYEESSAELAFDDGSVLTLTEDSLVFLREISSTVSGVKRQSIEIVEGQADLDSRPKRPRLSDVEVVVGEARLRPQPDATRVAQARARRVEAGGAQVMVYAGSGEVEAAGARVTVPRGMGTSVPAAGPPRPPESLLPRPRLLRPRPRSTWDFANPPFAWAEVPGAASYTLEVCRDAACGELLQRVQGLREPEWSPEGLPVGELHWRVTAVGPSGLDGYPAAASALTVRSDRVDRDPPVVAVRIDGACSPGADGAVILGRGARLLVEARDDAAGVSELRLRWDGGPWRLLRDPVVEPPPSAEQRLEVQAVDGFGREGPVLSLTLRRDLAAPGPPVVRGEPGRSYPQELR